MAEEGSDKLPAGSLDTTVTLNPNTLSTNSDDVKDKVLDKAASLAVVSPSITR